MTDRMTWFDRAFDEAYEDYAAEMKHTLATLFMPKGESAEARAAWLRKRANGIPPVHLAPGRRRRAGRRRKGGGRLFTSRGSMEFRRKLESLAREHRSRNWGLD